FLKAELWPLCETVARRLKDSALAARSVTLKLKTGKFKILTRQRRLGAPTQLAATLYRDAEALLEAALDGTRYRLIGVGGGDLVDGAEADPPDLLNPVREKDRKVERAIDAVRAKLGRKAIGKGRGLSRPR
ncbi:MAG: DinB/UmuC family translesion DNA polymerase, partial [Rhodospirillales bacterium]